MYSTSTHRAGTALLAIGVLAAASFTLAERASAHSSGFAAPAAAPMRAAPIAAAPSHSFATPSVSRVGTSTPSYTPLGTRQLGLPSALPSATKPVALTAKSPNSSASSSALQEQEALDAILSLSRLPPVPPARIQDPAPNSTPSTSAGSTTAGSPLVPPLAPPSSTTETSVIELSSGGSAPGTQDIAFGGGGPTLVDCMALWDKSTDMSKAEWKDTCVRTMNGTNLTPEDISHVADVSRIIGDSEQGVPETRAGKHPRHVRSARRNGETKSAADASTSRKGAERSEPSAELN